MLTLYLGLYYVVRMHSRYVYVFRDKKKPIGALLYMLSEIVINRHLRISWSCYFGRQVTRIERAVAITESQYQQESKALVFYEWP